MMQKPQTNIPIEQLVQCLSQIPYIQVSIIDQEVILFGDWAMKWLNTYKRGVVKDNTFWGTYYEPVVLHLIPAFGDRPLDSITPDEVQDYFKSLRGRYSMETLKKIRHALKLIYDTAVEMHLCFKSPVTSELTLISDKEPAVKRTWSQEQYDTAYRYALSHPHGLDIITLMETAMTRSELLGLTWDDLDAKNRVLTLSNGLVATRNVSTGQYELVHDGLKNKHRHRSIPISQLLTGLLTLKPRTVMVSNRKAGIPAHEVHTRYIFHAPQGGPYNPTNWYRRVLLPFMNDLQTAHPDIPMLTTHELRHTRATLLKDTGTDLFSVARLLGHRNLDMLAKRYAHDNIDTLRKALNL